MSNVLPIHIRFCINKTPEEVLEFIGMDEKLKGFGPGNHGIMVLFVPPLELQKYNLADFRVKVRDEHHVRIGFADSELIKHFTPDLTLPIDAVTEFVKRAITPIDSAASVAVCSQRIENSAERPVRGKEAEAAAEAAAAAKRGGGAAPIIH